MEIANLPIWFILSIIFFIIEIFTSTLLALYIGLGALVASIVAYYNYSIISQFATFTSIVLLLFFIVPLYKKKKKTIDDIAMNTDALIDSIGIVTVDIEPNHCGRVLVHGNDWMANSVDKSMISKGSSVKVLYVDSTILIVKEEK